MPENHVRASYDVIVVGAGLIGLSCAWRAAERGLRVLVADPAPGDGASGVAAGMLAPVTELHHGEETLLRLSLDAARAYPLFVADVERVGGLEVGYHRCGTLAVALDRGDHAALEDLHATHRRLGFETELLTGSQCRRREPLLATSVAGGALVASDHQVDARRLQRGLRAAAAAAGVHLVEAAAAIRVHGNDRNARAEGVELDDGRTVHADQVLIAAGCRSGPHGGLRLLGMAPARATRVLPPVRPVKGQILRLRVPRTSQPFLSGTVRGTVHGSSVYLVPREDGELVVGATSEEMGFDTSVTAGGVHGLLRDAQELVPGVSELELVEATARLRPGSPDNAPIVGATSLPGLLVATGHHRNGVLLAGVTGSAVARLLAEGVPPPGWNPFAPSRFETNRTEGAAV